MVGLISWLDKPLSFMFLIINGNINKNAHCFYNFINPLQLDTENSTLCSFACNWFICYSFYYRLFTDLSEKYSKATCLFEWRPSLKGCYLIKSSKTSASACRCFSYFLNYQRVSSVSVVWTGKKLFNRIWTLSTDWQTISFMNSDQERITLRKVIYSSHVS